MKHVLKNLALFILAILILNILTWFFIGRDSILLKGADIEQTISYIQKPDTLFLFIGKVEDEYNYRFSDFSRNTIDKLETELESQNITVIVDSRTLPLDDPDSDARSLLENTGANVLAYDIAVRPKFPLVTEIFRTLWVPGFGTDDGAVYLWIFGWRELYHTGTGVS